MQASQRMIMIDNLNANLDSSSFITLDGSSMEVIQTSFQNLQPLSAADSGSGANSAPSLPEFNMEFENMREGLQGRGLCGNTTATGTTEEQKTELQTRFYTAIGVSVICLLVVMAICCNCGNIRLAVNLFDEAGTCVFAIPGILFQPIYTLFILILAMTICVSQFLFVRQVFVPVVIPDGNSNAGQVLWMEKSMFWQYIWVFTFFVTVWVWYFIDGCHQVTLAGAVNNWYSVLGRIKTPIKKL